MTTIGEGERATPRRPRARERLLDAIRATGPVSRVELAALTGLTEASVSTAVRRLLQDGVVVESGRSPTAGKPRVLLQLDPGGRTAVGVDLATTATTCVLAGQTGGVLARSSVPTAGTADGADLARRVARQVDLLFSASGVDRERCLGVGLVRSGPPGRSHDEPCEALREVTGRPVHVEDDATAAAVGEYWVARVDPARSFAALCMGATLGAGIVLAGTAHRGTHGAAGEFGHVCLDVDGPTCRCGGRGCLEVLAGPAAVVGAALADPAARAEAHLDPAGRGDVVADFTAVARAARAGGSACRGLLEGSARFVAAAAESVVNLLDVDLLVLTGPGFAAAASVYGRAVQERLGPAGRRSWRRDVTVTVSSAAATAPAVGAAALVLQDRLRR
ncbi:ROK family transcriptional regulator [Kineococcus sp. G2]|uniref:ROK family transcriptional regulator n=1 Tax=Kineococcus sp. G2 TaxID=3127484 RepID=UPI00301BB016